MIYFDEYDVMKTPNYYVQWMYANNYGEQLINTTLDRVDGTGAYKAMADTQTDIYQVSSVDDKYIYLKLVNSADFVKDVTVDYKDITAKEAEVITISGSAKDENQMGNETVKPVTAKAELKDGKLIYEVPAMSFTVIKVPVDGTVVEDPVDKSALDAAIKAAVSDTDKDKYTGATWKRYANALKAAKEVQADKDATQEEVDSAVKALTDAQKALKESKPVEDIFKDISNSDWYKDNVQYVYDNEYMTGMNKEEFGPEVVLSRSHFATILYRIEGEPDVEYKESFTDVPDKQFYTNAVMWASSDDVKVITGYEDGRFGPADAITREQFATMMYRYAKYKGFDVKATDDLKGFPDAGTVSTFAENAVKWAVAEGLIKGDNGNINPQGEANRAECATIIYRFMENVAK